MKKQKTSIRTFLIIFAYIGMSVLLYTYIPNYRIHFITRNEFSTRNTRPIILYSQRDLSKIYEKCTCWINCTCISGSVDYLLKSSDILLPDVDVLMHSPFDISLILQHKITKTPVILQKDHIYAYTSHKFIDYIKMFRYFFEGISYFALSEMQKHCNIKIITYLYIIMCVHMVVAKYNSRRRSRKAVCMEELQAL
ncbi:uncharacterized protein NESG_02459 [Nematocida ausubeli]|uniref:Uncharacterized protein n=1 Tax=Nematocida ausubeli (strain ATCC PRA-371 / ERTm2) TaxID=1913371 RepID=A0A086IZ19_NEMA1|nr:uncharacterized protein NESG_02459 [Nematocida ausubeli]KAI5132262.1 hypothetical protein NEAUS06_0051 [Nematocida ausubeli]KFG25137.1 hypothetical protein NESG_02459 [Nematocida ausubeli]